MQKKRFVIEGPRVQGVGFRPLLVGRGKTDYHLRVYARNKDDDKVEVVVEGEEKQFKEKGEFDRFYKDIQRGKLQPKGAEVKTIGEPEPFEVNPNDYVEFTQGLQLEQMGKFIKVGEDIRGSIDGMSGDMKNMSDGIKDVKGSIDNMSSDIKGISGGVNTTNEKLDLMLDELPKRIAKEMKG